MKYEIDMMSGKKTRPVFETEDLLLHKKLNQECRIIKKDLDSKSFGRSLYTLSDSNGEKFTTSRTVLLKDFKYIGN